MRSLLYIPSLVGGSLFSVTSENEPSYFLAKATPMRREPRMIFETAMASDAQSETDGFLHLPHLIL